MCALNTELVELKCHSFLSVYVKSVTYGRNSTKGKELCDGDKPKDSKAPAMSCYDEEFNLNLLLELDSLCLGNFNCSYTIPTVPLDPVCNGISREARIEYLCGKPVSNSRLIKDIFSPSVECFPWHSYVGGADCIRKSLINNKWLTVEQLSAMEEADIKNFLIKKLNFYYDSEVHSIVDLSMREITGDKGSLCGMASLYQAARQTILTVSQIKQMSFNDVKIQMGLEMLYDKTTSIKMRDEEFVKLFFDCKNRTINNQPVKSSFALQGFVFNTMAITMIIMTTVRLQQPIPLVGEEDLWRGLEAVLWLNTRPSLCWAGGGGPRRRRRPSWPCGRTAQC